MDAVIACGQPAPLFSLPALDGRTCCLADQRGRMVVLNFWSAECPWAERADQEILSYLAEWGEAVEWWTIPSNANEPQELVRSVAGRRGLRAVLLDSNQQVADLYGAQTTPHLFVVDGEGILRYQGALDDVTFRQRIPTRDYLRQAVKALLAGEQPDPDFTLPYGCTIVRICG